MNHNHSNSYRPSSSGGSVRKSTRDKRDSGSTPAKAQISSDASRPPAKIPSNHARESHGCDSPQDTSPYTSGSSGKRKAEDPTKADFQEAMRAGIAAAKNDAPKTNEENLLKTPNLSAFRFTKRPRFDSDSTSPPTPLASPSARANTVRPSTQTILPPPRHPLPPKPPTRRQSPLATRRGSSSAIRRASLPKATQQPSSAPPPIQQQPSTAHQRLSRPAALGNSTPPNRQAHLPPPPAREQLLRFATQKSSPLPVDSSLDPSELLKEPFPNSEESLSRWRAKWEFVDFPYASVFGKLAYVPEPGDKYWVSPENTETSQ